MEQVVQAKPFVKEVIEELFDEKLIDSKLESLNEALDKVFGNDQQILNYILFIYNNTEFYDNEISIKLESSFSNWLYSISIKYGWEIQHLARMLTEKYDWNSISHKIVHDGRTYLEIKLERLDGKFITFNSDRSSILKFIQVYTSKLKFYPKNELEQTELESVNKCMQNLNNFLNEFPQPPE